MASVTIVIPNSNWSVADTHVAWIPPDTDHIDLGVTLSTDGATALYLGRLNLPRSSGQNMTVRLSGGGGQSEDLPGPEFSNTMETSGTITFIASNGASLTVTGISDSSEPYSWMPSNFATVTAFANTVAGLTDYSLTVTFYDGVNSPATGVPTVSNTMPRVGDTLTADASGIADADGLGTFNYQWQRDGMDIAGATADTYTVVNADLGSLLTVVVSFMDGRGNSESRTSVATIAVVDPLILADGTPIVAEGTLGEATGIRQVINRTGDGTPLVAHGALGEGVGSVLVFGDGTAVVGHGSLGEASGYIVIVGSGTPIIGHGSLSDATGFHIPVVNRDAAVFTTAGEPTVRVTLEKPFLSVGLYRVVLVNDRLDLIAARIYPDADLDAAMRTLIWANKDVPTEKLLLPDLGMIIDTPPVEAVILNRRPLPRSVAD